MSIMDDDRRGQRAVARADLLISLRDIADVARQALERQTNQGFDNGTLEDLLWTLDAHLLQAYRALLLLRRVNRELKDKE
jgi:hypothetical protein